ncbi:MAG: hypothetical protein JWL59_2478 [Chthoniobacteraceae bacterium]|nr:hypothetical protein [Chthoniobacteraceae bacterium]
MSCFRPLLFVAFSFAGVLTASAHLSYIGRDYGTFTGGSLQGKTISNQNVETTYGWADGTDADFAEQHYQSYFKFTLQKTLTITITVTALDPSKFLPAFSIYSGLGHTSPPDYDETGISQDYLASLPGPPKEGAFDALHTWKMGNDDGTTFADLSTFTYVDNAADGTAANYGPAAGIFGDGLADGTVSRSFTLGPGSYSVAIGGANYFDQDDANFYGFITTATVVPEPSSALLMSGSLLVLTLRRRRAARVAKIL